MSLFDASFDLNPHQIEAALFALNSPLSNGAMLADEVGLGKTIEAGIVLCQLWAERKRKLLVICPASLRSQWAAELSEKFNLPARAVDAKTRRDALRLGVDPLVGHHVVIVSFHFANALSLEIGTIPWDLVTIDEAHKLRNVYRPSNKVGQGIKAATDGRRKLLLTATPLQNSLLELYGLSTLIDEHLFGDVDSFRSQYMAAGASLDTLRQRVRSFTTRTLRRDVTEYIRYTQRRPITQPFRPSDDEYVLYEQVSSFLQRPDLYSLPSSQRHLTTLILRKLLASSTRAIEGTLVVMRDRVAKVTDPINSSDGGDTDVHSLPFIDDIESTDELLDEILAEGDDLAEMEEEPVTPVVDPIRLAAELGDLDRLIALARNVGQDAKAPALLTAIETGFATMDTLGAPRKALVFTESRRTQQYLKEFLDTNGYAGKIVVFNGSNNDPESTGRYEAWRASRRQRGEHETSRAIDVRTALIEHFRDGAEIMLATEAAAEGVNLQFCSLVVNYDLPWNPQRIEQRIGRCHRYGQMHDVVVVNFLNERNEADRRVLELLTDKFRLFDGVFGASDEVLGAVESGVDFEQRVLAIYQQCRTPAAIQSAFDALQHEMESRITARMDDTRQKLFDHFDEDVHHRLRMTLEDARAQLDQFGERFWALTRHVLDGSADFDDTTLSFELQTPPTSVIPIGTYHLISKSAAGGDGEGQLYRLSHPLGEWVIDTAKVASTPPGLLVFDISNHPRRVTVVEELRGLSGRLMLEHLTVESFEREEYLLLSGVLADGRSVDHETLERMLGCSAAFKLGATSVVADDRCFAEANQRATATVAKSLEANNEHFVVARERLERWADDRVASAERALTDTKNQIKVMQREARIASTLQEQQAVQQGIQRLERQKRRQRQEIFDVEDEITSQRDELISGLQRRMSQGSTRELLFSAEFRVV